MEQAHLFHLFLNGRHHDLKEALPVRDIAFGLEARV